MTAGLDEAVEAALKVSGITGKKDLTALYLAARGVRLGGRIVEIGSFRGRSTVALALGLRDGKNQTARVYAVDPFQGNLTPTKIVPPTFDEFLRNNRAAGIEEWVVPLKMASEEAAKQWDGKPIDVLWIDGKHEYPAPAEDIRAWAPFLKTGGLLLVDDCYMPGVERSLAEEVAASSEFVRLWIDDGLAYAVKGPCKGWRLWGKRVYFRVWTALAALRFALLPA